MQTTKDALIDMAKRYLSLRMKALLRESNLREIGYLGLHDSYDDPSNRTEAWVVEGTPPPAYLIVSSRNILAITSDGQLLCKWEFKTQRLPSEEKDPFDRDVVISGFMTQYPTESPSDIVPSTDNKFPFGEEPQPS